MSYYISIGQAIKSDPQKGTKMNNAKKTLEIGKDYGFVFGLTKGMGTMVFNGNDSWTATKSNGQTMTNVSQKTTASALEYINRAGVSMGAMA